MCAQFRFQRLDALVPTRDMQEMPTQPKHDREPDDQHWPKRGALASGTLVVGHRGACSHQRGGFKARPKILAHDLSGIPPALGSGGELCVDLLKPIAQDSPQGIWWNALDEASQ